MAKEFRLPDLGEGIHEGEVLAVKVERGQQVNEDQTILEVETDKAAVEIPSPYSDVVTDIRVAQGDIVHVGDVMMIFGGTADNVAKETAKVSAQPAERKGGTVEPTEKRGRASVTPTESRERRREGPVPAAPSTRRLARELGVDLHLVPASGPGGRVLTDDVRAFAEVDDSTKSGDEDEAARLRAGRHVHPEPSPQLAGISPQVVEVPSLPDYDRTGPIERVPLRSVRRATAKQMALAWSQIPHVATQDVVDITELEKLRERYKDRVRELGGALTPTVFVMKALTNALQEFPRFNATLDVESEEIILKKFYNIGVAVDTERGLLVPTIRNVDRKSIVQLAVDLKQLADRARAGEASLQDMQGGTITITNIGPLGGTGFAPIINFPEVAILGMARASIQPVAKTVAYPEGEAPRTWEDRYAFVPRMMLPLVLSFDHRVNDGAEAQRLMNRIIEQLENPEQLLLGL